jgi:anti-sigma factor RsiW
MSFFNAGRGHISDHLVPYLTGQLAPDEEAAIEAHLLQCRGCREDAKIGGQVADSLVAMSPAEIEQLMDE